MFCSWTWEIVQPSIDGDKSTISFKLNKELISNTQLTQVLYMEGVTREAQRTC